MNPYLEDNTFTRYARYLHCLHTHPLASGARRRRENVASDTHISPKFPACGGPGTILIVVIFSDSTFVRAILIVSKNSQHFLSDLNKGGFLIVIGRYIYGSLRQGGIHYLEFWAGSVYIAHASRGGVFVYF